MVPKSHTRSTNERSFCYLCSGSLCAGVVGMCSVGVVLLCCPDVGIGVLRLVGDVCFTVLPRRHRCQFGIHIGVVWGVCFRVTVWLVELGHQKPKLAPLEDAQGSVEPPLVPPELGSTKHREISSMAAGHPRYRPQTNDRQITTCFGQTCSQENKYRQTCCQRRQVFTDTWFLTVSWNTSSTTRLAWMA